MNEYIFTDFPSIKPFVISIWYGCGKPTPINDVLLPFVNEINDLLINGMVINGYQITIKIRCFVCDTPARSLLKGKYAMKCCEMKLEQFAQMHQ